MEVVDDMKLGKIVKQAGFRSSRTCARGGSSSLARRLWGILVTGVTKNFFAAQATRRASVLAGDCDVVAERSAIRCNFHQPWMDSASSVAAW